MGKITCHDGAQYADKGVDWRPHDTTHPSTIMNAFHESCSYCGSIKPEALVAALNETTTRVEWADMKYGYPHKLYLDVLHPDAPETKLLRGFVKEPTHAQIASGEHMIWEPGRWVHCKFYTTHLMDVPLGPLWSELVVLLDQRTRAKLIRDEKGTAIRYPVRSRASETN